MLKIGKYNSLQVARNVDFGAYLADRDGNEVLLPARYISMPLQPGNEMEVFVYNNSSVKFAYSIEYQ
ncbi:S1 RNA-binding domain-containing protein [uncultured Duncaniella sp.]|uniref:S1 RNA-binding domain-containing protein n=1 Tax=uncultured Duncaniella sp. TaxID=2768039 RepID=UPI0033A7E1F9